MKRSFLIVILFAGILSSTAQVKCNINKAYAYFTVTMQGTQRVDDNGNPVPPVPVVERIIYLDCKGTNKPAIQSVSYNNTSFTPSINKVEGNLVSVGKKIGDQKEIVTRIKKGNTFWKVELQSSDNKPQDAVACRNIVIHLKVAGKICTYRITGGEYQLYTPPAY